MYYITVSSFLQMVDEIFCKIISVYGVIMIKKSCPGKIWAALEFNRQNSDYFARCLRMVSAIRRLPRELR